MSSSLDRYSPVAALQPYHRPAIRKIDAFIHDLGGGDDRKGRERFLACLLLTAHTDERLDLLLQYTEDESLATRSVGDLAIAAGFRAGELIKILKETGLLVAQAHATQIVADHLPAVVQDIVTRAQNHWIACATCDATGSVTPDPTKADPNPGPEPCKTCKGRGQVLVAADPDRQDRVLDMARMLPESKGHQTNVGVNIGANGKHPDGSLAAGSFGTLFSQLVGATDRILHPDRARLTGAQIPTFSVQTPADPGSAPPEPADAAEDGVILSSPDDPPPSGAT
jgi:hypothetical protein